MRDITPPSQKRSIRNIAPPRREQRESRHGSDGVVHSPADEEQPREIADVHNRERRPDHDAAPPKERRSVFLWIGGSIGAVLVVSLIGFFVISQFAGATVEITPQTETHSIDQILTVMHTSDAEDVAFERIRFESDELYETTFEAQTVQEVEERASGVITVYNEHSESDQVLVATTRFESPEGRIYRIREQITVPGMDGGAPGSIDVRVYADEPGEQYNIEPTTFTIPGFSGTAQFDGFYAVSESAFDGGYVGVRPEIDEEELNNALSSLRETLRRDLHEEARHTVPDDFVFFDNAFVIEEDITYGDAEDGQVTVSLSGVLHGALFNRESLAMELLRRSDGNGDVPVNITNWDELEFSFESEFGRDGESVDIAISGTAQFYWVIDTERLRQELAGLPKDEIESLFSESPWYPSIQSAEVSFTPFWSKSFPRDPESITILVDL